MDPDRWQRVNAVFQAVLERPREARPTFLAEACEGDAELRTEVESLLDSHDRAGSFMDHAVFDKHLSAGTRLGPYEVREPIGAGGMGEVYRARDTKLNRDVALKILPGLFAADPDRRARFQREAEVLASLNHPNIAAIYGLEESVGLRALVLELVEGPTLAVRIARGPMPLDEALPIARQIAEALEAAHEHGIIHRDLKPGNVKVRHDRTVKVLDFGLAKALTGDAAGFERTQLPTVTAVASGAGLILGTAAYMSPEQARGRQVDKRTDVWAFGCVLYEMLTGRQAFADETTSDTIAAILQREPDWKLLPESTPDSIRRLLHRCLEKDPRRRVHDIGDARIEIEDALAVPATDAAATGSSRRVPQRRRWLFGLAALVLLAAVVAGLLVRGPAVDLPPLYHQVTFRQGTVTAARFAPDGQTIVYSATWEGAPVQLFSTRIDNPESARLPVPGAHVLSISSSGKMAVRLNNGRRTLAEVPLAGQAPRELLDDVSGADWAPDGNTMVVSHTVQGRTRLEYPIGTVLYDPGPRRGVEYPEFSPKGDLIGFMEYEGTRLDTPSAFRIAVVDLAGHVRILSEGWSEVFALAWAPGGDEIWVSAREAGATSGGLALHAVTLTGRHRVVARMPGLPLIQEIWRDGRVLLRHDDWPQALKCQTSAATGERDLSWLDFSWVRDISLEGQRVLFDETGFAGGSRGGVYLRKTDGSAPVRLGDGQALALSPDGASALAFDDASSAQLAILPTGPGQARVLRGEGLIYRYATWFPDGTQILAGGQEAGRPPAVYVQAVGGGAPRRLVDGTDRGVVSPDGRTVATIGPAGSVTLTPVAGGPSRVVAGLPAGASLLRWTDRNEELFASVSGDIPAQILRFNIETGRTTLWRTVTPSDLAGFNRITGLSLTADGQSYCYSYLRVLSAVFVVDGLR